MSSKCNDGTEAFFSKRLIYEDMSSQINVGSIDKYIAVCRRHFSELN